MRYALLLYCVACTSAPLEPLAEPPLVEDLQVGEVALDTTLGRIVIQLDVATAPITTSNFLDYVDAGFYDGDDGLGATIFHRVIPGFMVQGGGLTTELDRKSTGDKILNESDNGRLNLRGTLSMARTSTLNSATSQFFMNLVDNVALDPTSGTNNGYAVFADIIVGLDVLDTLAAQDTETVGGASDVPVDAIEILDVTRGPRPDQAPQ